MRVNLPMNSKTRSHLIRKKSLLQAKLGRKVTWDEFLTGYCLVRGVDLK